MTQYPPPPPPPPYGYGYDPYAQQRADLLAPARRAALVMFTLGGLMLLCGVCFGTFAFTVPIGQFISESGVKFPAPPPGMSLVETIRLQAAVACVGSLVVGVIVVMLAVFVRRGGRGAVVTSMVFVSILLLLTLLSLAGTLPQLAQQPGAAAPLCVMLLPIGLMIAALMSLAQAAKAAPQVSAIRQQQLFQTWQYQQQQQAHQQGGYAMPAPPPAPPDRPNEDVPR